MEQNNIDYKYCELSGLPHEFFYKNRKNYISNLKKIFTDIEKDSIIVVEGGREVYRYDTDMEYYHFQQEGNFYYLSGVTHSKCYGILDLKSEDFTLFYELTQNEREKIFLKIPTLEELSKKYSLPVLDKHHLYEEIKKRDPKKIYVLKGINTDSGSCVMTAKLSFPQDFEEYQNRIDENPIIYEILAETRTIKTEEEISLLRFINKITIEAHLNAYKNVRPDVLERDMENSFYNYLKTNYYTRTWAYQLICGCGTNSATLHYIDNDKVLKNGDLILMDMGVSFAGYVSDVTSTIPVNGKYNDNQARIYQLVLNANREVMRNLKPGVYWPDMHLLAERIILTGLKEMKLIVGEVDDMLRERIAYYFMPHGLGHFMGIDVHDVGGYLSFTPKRIQEKGLSSLRTARYLVAGNVITVEPGIYFIPFLLEKAFKDENIKKYFIPENIKKFENFGGIRIEDDVVITLDGCENLTQSLPREIKEIEDLMNSSK